ncbi:MAG: radical SAM protein [Candidatus Tectomicrobia bacterium]|nr:radical SAM protein [Candidatus Tectomicrobia bacterium]
MPTPCYLRTYKEGGFAAKLARAYELLAPCVACPRRCQVDRLHDQRSVCRTGRWAKVDCAFPHHGEEDCLRGWNGSGTIFFSFCNLRCVFCQNFSISQLGSGTERTPAELARMMLRLQEHGCHNINFVTPEHVVPQIVEALPLAIEQGLRLPLVYNTSAYDDLESLRLMEGVIDIYMPDFKVWDAETARRLLKARDYPEVARAAIKEMHRQVGDLRISDEGLATRGVLVRHLVMPNDLAGTRQIMRFLAREVSPDSYVNVMGQYRPAWKAARYPEINCPTLPEETQRALDIAEEEGISRVDQRLCRLRY